jgi:hypothetical protein
MLLALRDLKASPVVYIFRFFSLAATHGPVFYLYLIIKELRFLPKFSSNIYLDRFTLPPNRIIHKHATVPVWFFSFPAREKSSLPCSISPIHTAPARPQPWALPPSSCFVWGFFRCSWISGATGGLSPLRSSPISAQDPSTTSCGGAGGSRRWGRAADVGRVAARGAICRGGRMESWGASSTRGWRGSGRPQQGR